MKGGLDEVSLAELRRGRARGASSGRALTLGDLAFVCPLHMKRSMYEALLVRLGIERRSGCVPRRHRPHERRRLRCSASTARRATGGSPTATLVLLLSAGTGYTWAATVVRWGADRVKIRATSSGLRAGSRSRRRGSTRSPRRPATASGSTSTRSAPKDGPFGTTVAPRLPDALAASGAVVRGGAAAGARWAINYGLNRVRFPAPVPVGSRLRGSFEVVSVEEIEGGGQVTMTVTVEREGGDEAGLRGRGRVSHYT